MNFLCIYIESSIFQNYSSNGINTTSISSNITSTGAEDNLFQGIFIFSLPKELNFIFRGSSNDPKTSGFNETFSITTLPLHTPNYKFFWSNPDINFPKYDSNIFSNIFSNINYESQYNCSWSIT